MKMQPDSDLLRGNTPTLVLAVLQDAPYHGYAIASEIDRRSNNALKLKQGTLYPALHALERDGLIVSEWEIMEGERPRRVYKITEAGRTELARRMRSWSDFATAMTSVIGGDLREQPA
jgi:PadR family transcriptional regulator PadR